MNNVAVLIVTYNSSEEISRCLRSVFEQRDYVSRQVIVVDNASTDGTADLIRREFPEVILIEPGRNLGFAAGVNEAARHANAKFLLLLNPDTEILNHGIDRIVDFAERNPRYRVTVAYFQIRRLSRALFVLGMAYVVVDDAFCNGFVDARSTEPVAGPGIPWRLEEGYCPRSGRHHGMFSLVPTQIWKTLGGLDERYFMYGEDVDFALRARAAGHRPVICPDATLVHEVGRSSSSPIHKMMFLFRGKAELAHTHWEGIAQTVALALLQTGVGLRAMLAGARRLIFRRGGSSDRWMELWYRRKEWIAGYGANKASNAPARLEPAPPVAQ